MFRQSPVIVRSAIFTELTNIYGWSNSDFVCCDWLYCDHNYVV